MDRPETTPDAGPKRGASRRRGGLSAPLLCGHPTGRTGGRRRLDPGRLPPRPLAANPSRRGPSLAGAAGHRGPPTCASGLGQVRPDTVHAVACVVNRPCGRLAWQPSRTPLTPASSSDAR